MQSLLNDMIQLFRDLQHKFYMNCINDEELDTMQTLSEILQSKGLDITYLPTWTAIPGGAHA